MEAEGLSALAADEKQRADKLRLEHRDCLSELKQSREELRVSQQEVAVVQARLESARAMNAHAESVKEALTLEVNRLRETGRLELQRIEGLGTARVEEEDR